MLSSKGSDMICVSSNNTVAVYKGLTVAVYTVDKSEVNLTRQDLVELINVCSSVTVCIRVIERNHVSTTVLYSRILPFTSLDLPPMSYHISRHFYTVIYRIQ